MLNLLTLSTVGLATAFNVSLNVESSDSSLNNSGISNIHFGAGLNGVLISPETIYYNVNVTDHTVYQDIEIASGPMSWVLGELFGQLAVQVGGSNIPAKVDCCGNYLTINGSSSVFYACDKVQWDPYNYVNSNTKGVAVYSADESAPDYCSPIKIKAVNA